MILITNNNLSLVDVIQKEKVLIINSHSICVMTYKVQIKYGDDNEICSLILDMDEF